MLSLWLSTRWMNTAGVDVQLHTFLTSKLDGGEWLTSCSGCFPSGKQAPSTPKGGVRSEELSAGHNVIEVKWCVNTRSLLSYWHAISQFLAPCPQPLAAIEWLCLCKGNDLQAKIQSSCNKVTFQSWPRRTTVQKTN